MPPQPAGVWNSVYNDSKWKDATGPDRYRRAIYTYIKRTSSYPSFLTFDASDHDTSLARRIPTNTPLQALVTLNDPVYIEAAQALARRIVREGGSTIEARARFGLQLCLARPPSPKEEQRLTELLTKQTAALEAAPQDAKQLAPAPLPATMDVAQAAAWTMLARVLLNLDEFITRE